MNLDKYANIGTHWIALFIKPKYTVYIDSFGVEHVPGIKTLKQIYLGYKHMIQK